MCIFPRNKNEPTITVTIPTTTNMNALPTAPNFVIQILENFIIKTFFLQNMAKRKDVAIWIAILAGGIGFFLFYGVAAELMR
tara:strand:- start:251 stop:496 length:246 start_codon:yes stop_codon:yes gene_type:complete